MAESAGSTLLVALLELDLERRSATTVRGRAIREALRAAGHDVEVLSPGWAKVESLQRARRGLRARLVRRVCGRQQLPHLWDLLADEMEPLLRGGNLDAAIGRGPEIAYSLTRAVNVPIKIVDLLNVASLEMYSNGGVDPGEIEATFVREAELLRRVDHVITPHRRLDTIVLEAFTGVPGLAGKLVAALDGCDPAARHAQYADRPRIVYAGSYYPIHDPYLLALLTRDSPFVIDCYGAADPNRAFLPARLNYRGYAPDLSFLADYQFGLITVSRDRLRQHSPALKLPGYFSHGLPVLFPEWMKQGHDYPDCAVAYTEETFVSRVEWAREPSRWRAMSDAARETARGLTWNRTLAPLVKLLDGKSRCR